jgi:hypothetical protein
MPFISEIGKNKTFTLTLTTMGDSKVIKESRNLSDNATKGTKDHASSKKDHKQKLDRTQDLGDDDDLASEEDEQEDGSKADYASAGEHQDGKSVAEQDQEDHEDDDNDDDDDASDQGSVSDFSEEEDEEEKLLKNLVGLKVNRECKVLDQDGNVVGEVVHGNRKKAVGRRVKDNGAIIDSKGNYIAGVSPVRPDNAEEAPADEKEEDKPEDEEAKADAPEDEQKQEEEEKAEDEEAKADAPEDEQKQEEEDQADEEDKPEDQADEEDKPEDQAAEEDKPEDQAPEEEEQPKNEIPEDANTVDESGKVLSPTGEVVGKLIKGNRHKLAGKMVDEEGNVLDENGNSVGKVEMNPPEKPGVPDDANTVDESGKILSPTGEVVGKLKKGNRHKLAGMMVDEEGDVIDENGTLVGKAEFNQPEPEPVEEEPPKKEVPDDANTVDESGKILSPTGEVVGKLIKGNRHKLAGMEVEEDGSIVDENGKTVGKAEFNATEKSEEEKKAEAEEQEQRKIAGQMGDYVEQALNRVKPILKMITEHIETEEKKPEKERDEEGLVKNVRPLIEEGSNILGEANGAIRGLDPTGKIAKTAQAKSAERKASPEEYHLAELLSNLTGEVTQTIEKAKKKIAGMPHAEKELSPLWNLLQNPLLQILAAVGLLLSGVLGLLGNLLNGLGLGGLVNNLLGGLGLDKILQNLGVGKLLGGGKKK